MVSVDCGTHLRPILQEVVKVSIFKMSLKNTLVKLLPHLSEATELNNSFSINYTNLDSEI